MRFVPRAGAGFEDWGCRCDSGWGGRWLRSGLSLGLVLGSEGIWGWGCRGQWW